MSNLADRLDFFVDRSAGPDQCWAFTGSTTKNGYGKIGRGGAGNGWMLAHRAAYELWVGPIPDEMLVLHSCDNRICCNPAHLRPGTQADNMNDMTTRKRHTTGSARPLAKITEADIPDILARLDAGESQRSVAEHYGIAQPSVSRIKRGLLWKSAQESLKEVRS